MPSTSTLNENQQQIRTIVKKFLKCCVIAYPVGFVDPEFNAACFDDAKRRGFDMILLEKYLVIGINIAANAYNHLSNKDNQIYIAVYTSLMTYLDDHGRVEDIRLFNERLIRKQLQPTKILNDVVSLLAELPQRWGSVSANLILVATIKFLTSLILDYDTRNMSISRYADNYAAFSRGLSGVSDSYACFTLPPEMPLKVYAQVIPELANYTNYANDVISFYKEESAGESDNYISLQASHHGISKIEALERVADEAVDAYERGMNILQDNEEARHCFRSYAVGYVGFHEVSWRYRLEELDL